MATSATARTDALPFIHPDDMPDRYALAGRGTCMEPLVPDGALVAFDKSLEPVGGDIVCLTFTREEARRRGLPGMIKRLVMGLPPKGFDGLIVAEQINPPRIYSFDTKDVLAVHKCIGLPERRPDGSAWLRLPKGEQGHGVRGSAADRHIGEKIA